MDSFEGNGTLISLKPKDFHRSWLATSPLGSNLPGFLSLLLILGPVVLRMFLILFLSQFPLCQIRLNLWGRLNVNIYLKSVVCVKVTQSCPTVCNSMDYTVHGILQARILEWVAFPFSRWSCQPRPQTQVSHIAGRFFISWATREAPPTHRGIVTGIW